MRAEACSIMRGVRVLQRALKIKKSSQSEQSAMKREKSKRKTAAAHKQALLTKAFECFSKSNRVIEIEEEYTNALRSRRTT
jgi:hypothetical protein